MRKALTLSALAGTAALGLTLKDAPAQAATLETARMGMAMTVPSILQEAAADLDEAIAFLKDRKNGEPVDMQQFFFGNTDVSDHIDTSKIYGWRFDDQETLIGVSRESIPGFPCEVMNMDNKNNSITMLALAEDGTLRVRRQAGTELTPEIFCEDMGGIAKCTVPNVDDSIAIWTDLADGMIDNLNKACRLGDRRVKRDTRKTQ